MAERNLLVTDVDGTMLGDDDALAEFARWYESRREHLWLVYSSGRFVDSVIESIRSTRLPPPRAIIGGVGTQICGYPEPTPLGDWHERLNGDFCADRVRSALADVPRLELQPECFLSAYKVSYYLHEATRDELEGIAARLVATGLHARLVYSSRRDLDILPASADKGQAARYLVELWRLRQDAVYVSGDSANDNAMFAQGFRGIVVGNAHDELKALAGPRVYLARRHCAGGVLEGLLHFGVGEHHFPDRLAAG